MSSKIMTVISIIFLWKKYKTKALENQISNAFLIVHHNSHQLSFSVKFNPDKSISYLSEISGKWKSKYNEYQTNITNITNKSGIHIIRREKWHRLQKFVVIFGTSIKFTNL